jgi:hypothetical protein
MGGDRYRTGGTGGIFLEGQNDRQVTTRTKREIPPAQHETP